MSNFYQVTAPLVVLQNADGVTGDGYFYEKALIPAGFNDERCNQLVEEGYLKKVTVKAEADSEEPSGPPAKSAPKGDWEAYARSQGASDEDLEGVTKDDLVATYGD